MKTILLTNKQRKRRSNHVRRVIRHTSDRPRLSVFRSSKHISGQVIDDEAGRTLVALSSTAKALADQLSGKSKTERAHILGKELASRAKEAGIEKVVFDRGHFRYHGRVKAFAEGAREGGLQF